VLYGQVGGGALRELAKTQFAHQLSDMTTAEIHFSGA